MLQDVENVNLVKKVILTMTQLYKVAMQVSGLHYPYARTVICTVIWVTLSYMIR